MRDRKKTYSSISLWFRLSVAVTKMWYTNWGFVLATDMLSRQSCPCQQRIRCSSAILPGPRANPRASFTCTAATCLCPELVCVRELVCNCVACDLCHVVSWVYFWLISIVLVSQRCPHRTHSQSLASVVTPWSKSGDIDLLRCALCLQVWCSTHHGNSV